MAKKNKKRKGPSLNGRFTVKSSVKQAIVRDAEQLMETAFTGQLHAACLYWAGAVIIAARRRGERLILQAGSMSWPCVPECEDDGVRNTHFTYLWEGISHPLVQAQISRDRLPEMHVWAADLKRKEVIDLTTRFLPQQCESSTGAEWRTPEPPPFIWGGNSKLREHGALYRAEVDACVYADGLLQIEFRKAGLL